MERDRLHDDTLCDFCDEEAVAFGNWMRADPDGGPGIEGAEYQLCADCDAKEPGFFESVVSRGDQRLMEEVYGDPMAVARMKEKQVHEQMSAFAVLRAYGDPREWSA